MIDLCGENGKEVRGVGMGKREVKVVRGDGSGSEVGVE